MIGKATTIIALGVLLAAPALAHAPAASLFPESRPAGGQGAASMLAVTARLPPMGGASSVEHLLIQAMAVSGAVPPRALLRPEDASVIPAVATRAATAPALTPPVLPRTPAQTAEGEAALGAPASVLPPPPRPEGLDALVLAAATAPAAGPTLSPMVVRRSAIPRKRPETGRLRHLQRVAAAVRARPDPGPIAGRESAALCGVTGIEGRTIPPVTSNIQACGIAEPVRVTAVDGVTLSQAAVLHCDTARALNNWVRDALRPALASAATAPAQLRVAAHYSCRTRNHRRGAPVSEHGKGRAIDISAIRLTSGEAISVLEGWQDPHQGPILRAAHRAACGTFTTTLGPGSDGHHEDHFHYDTAQRRNAYCR